jgi:hypothetical protein
MVDPGSHNTNPDAQFDGAPIALPTGRSDRLFGNAQPLHAHLGRQGLGQQSDLLEATRAQEQDDIRAARLR